MNDLSQAIAEISIYRDRLRGVDPSFDDRFQKWAIAAILRSHPESNITSAASARPRKQCWSLLLSALPDEAILSLCAKLRAIAQEAT